MDGELGDNSSDGGGHKGTGGVGSSLLMEGTSERWTCQTDGDGLHQPPHITELVVQGYQMRKNGQTVKANSLETWVWNLLLRVRAEEQTRDQRVSPQKPAIRSLAL